MFWYLIATEKAVDLPHRDNWKTSNAESPLAVFDEVCGSLLQAEVVPGEQPPKTACVVVCLRWHDTGYPARVWCCELPPLEPINREQ
jgi:hypothetical protein